MDRMEDLISFNSPKGAPHNAQSITISNSPINNPFDDLETRQNKRKTESSSDKDVVPTIDIEGVVNENALDDSVFDANIEANSFPFFKIENFDCGRESLGILKLEAMDYKTTDIDWLSVPETYVRNSASSASSRENSSDPLNMAFLKSHSLRSNKTSVLSSASSCNSNAASLFNSGSLEGSELSKIYSVNSPLSNKNVTNSRLNEAFINSTDLSQQHTFRDCSTVDALLSDFCFERKLQGDLRNRIRSLTFVTDMRRNSDEVTTREIDRSVCINACKPKKPISLLKRTFARTMSKFEAREHDDSFNDSVFIEANHIASKIADGSILEISDGELDSLDCTPEPQWIEILDDDPPIKCETKDVFKTVDKMVPSTIPDDDLKLNTMKLQNISDGGKGHLSNCNSSGSSASRSDCIHNLSEIFIADKLSTSRRSQSKSKDAKELLENLSEIIQSENRSVEQTTEGQNLLYSLANILCCNDPMDSSKTKISSEDSGHSSIEVDQEENANCLEISFEALDLRTNCREDLPNLSKKSKRNRFSKSFSFPNAKPPPISNVADVEEKVMRSTSATSLDNKIRNDSVGSNNSSKNIVNFRTKYSSSGKLIPKKIEHKPALKKGPLKAVIPVGKMSKESSGKIAKKINTTPTSNYTSIFKSKRTSTPIVEKKMQQPVAQSTPEDTRKNPTQKPKSCSTTAQVYKRTYPVSPLTRPNSVGDMSNNETNKTNRTGSAPNLSNSGSKSPATSLLKPVMCRRRSASDLKNERGKVELKRSYSIGKDSGVSSSLARVRETIAKAKNNELAMRKTNAGSTVPVNQSRHSLGERNRMNTSIKPFNLMEKLKRATGKENAGH